MRQRADDRLTRQHLHPWGIAKNVRSSCSPNQFFVDPLLPPKNGRTATLRALQPLSGGEHAFSSSTTNERTTAVSFPTNMQDGRVCFLPFAPKTPRQWLRFRPPSVSVQKLMWRSPEVTRRVPATFHATAKAFRRPILAVACAS